MKKLVIFGFVFVLLAVFANANFGPEETVVQFAEDLNYGNQTKNMTVNVYYNCTGTRLLNISMPSGFTVSSAGGACTKINDNVTQCTLQETSPSNQGEYTVQGLSSADDYSSAEIPALLNDTSNCSLTNNITFVKIPDQDIFQTLVEYGRGRGNYFYSTFGGAGSGHTGTGCHYVPNGTMFELNFLHKVFNIRQYFNDPNLLAVNASFTCTYPNRTIVRTHMGTSISKSNTETNVTYFIDEIEGSWERMGYIGIDFDASEQQVGENLTINCRDITYTLPGLGNISVYADDLTFNLEVRDPHPFTANATAAATIGNGTQEVLIAYTITNNEVYSVDDVIIEIEAPDYSSFIGTRAELWGTGLEQYRIEKAQLLPGETETVILAARFNTSTAPNITSVNLTNGIKVKYTTCWERNAYNPSEYVQTIYPSATAAVNMGISAQITSVFGTLNDIYNILVDINDTTTQINNTVANIETLVNIINSTTIETNLIAKQINSTLNNISNKTSIILNSTNQIINDTSVIKELIDCDNVSDSPMCSDLDSLNQSAVNIQDIIIGINTTLSNYSINITINLSEQNLSINFSPDLSNITSIVDDFKAELNCTNLTGEPNASICRTLIRIENNTISINNTVDDINNLIDYFNNTVFANITLEQLYDSISNITFDTSDLLTEIRRIREFDEELVFLITDAFGMANEARNAADQGNLVEAADKLKEANKRLTQATVRLAEARKETQDSIISKNEIPTSTIFWVLGIIAMLVIGFFLFQKVPEEDHD